MKYHPFPYIDQNKSVPTDGAVLETPNYCYIADNETCASHYQNIEDSDGFHTCPFGFSSYVDSGGNLIYTGLRISGEYDREKLKGRVDNEEYLPTLPKRTVKRAAEKASFSNKEFDRLHNQLSNLSDKHEKIEDFVDVLLHEIRNFNKDIKLYAHRLDRKYEKKGQIKESIKKVNALSHLISVRLRSYDIEKNPDIITNSQRYPKVVYKKFDKARKVLGHKERSEDVQISLRGESFFEWPLYDIFDIVPFLILDNAVKYSPPNQDIVVRFDDSGERLEVTVKSLGPTVGESEIGSLTLRKERGEYASQVDNSGGGYGLYLTKTICKIHNVELAVDSGERKTTIDGVPYSFFHVTLRFE